MRHALLILSLILAFPCPALSQEKEPPPHVETRDEEYIETDMPTTQQGYELDFSIRPRAADIIREDYIRVPMRVKYGISNNLEVSVSPLTYFDNFFKGYFGLSMTDIALGMKYNFGDTYPLKGFDSAITLKHIMPVSYDTRISDGFYHYQPSFLLSTRFGEFYSFGASMGVNIVQGKGPPGSARPKDTLGTSLSLAYKPGDTTYTIETVYVTSEPYGGDSEQLFITPGASLDIKDWLYKVPGVWTLSSGIRIGLLDAPEDFEFLIKIKVHIRFDYKLDVMKMRLIKQT